MGKKQRNEQDYGVETFGGHKSGTVDSTRIDKG